MSHVSTTTSSSQVPYIINKKVVFQFKKCFIRRTINYEVLSAEEDQRRQMELDAYHQFKQNKENADILYLIDEKWISRWIQYLRGQAKEPDYINNERLHNMIFEMNSASLLKFNEDFILVHKSLFEYLYGIYGCDYFISTK